MAYATTKKTETTPSKPETEQEEAPGREHAKDPHEPNTVDAGEAASPEVPAGRSEFVDESDDTYAAPVGTATSGGSGSGAAAVVSAGLGIVSLTGTGLGDMLRARMEIIGQIKIGGGGAGGRGLDQVDALYGAPWHTAALVNGVFALVAVVIGVGLLAVYHGRADARPWVRAIALGGAVLGGIGVLIAGGMYFDLFAAQPALSSRP